MIENEKQKEERFKKEDKVAYYRLMSRGLKNKPETTVDNAKDLDYMIATILIDLIDEIKELKEEIKNLKSEEKKEITKPVTIKSK